MPAWARHLLVAALIVKAALIVVELAAGPVPRLLVVDLLATGALLVGGGVLLVGLTRALRQRLLWRVRRKLILSYVFIGFVPVLLVVTFFVLAGVLVLLNLGSFLVRAGFEDLADEARTLATTAAAEIRGAARSAEALDVLARKAAAVVDRYPGVAMAVVPLGASQRGAGGLRGTAGSWSHLEPPTGLPAWIGPTGFAGLLVYRAPDSGRLELVVRAVALPEVRRPAFAVVVDVPIDEPVKDRMRQATGIKVGEAAVVRLQGETLEVAEGRPGGAPFVRAASGPAGRWAVAWVSFLDSIDWATGRAGTVSLGLEVYLGELYERIAGTKARVGPFGSVGQIVLVTLGVVGVLFLLIEAAALAAGFVLARSITGSVHELFAGTERVRRGDFAQPVRVTSRDQLGELAASFNEMMRSIETLLLQVAEKKRLEEELRIARQIQESLLPREAVDLPGAAVWAVCVPAREVGGDYYDFFPLGPRKLGLLVADVSGKGTSAALYMAELKGLVLSLSRIYESPKQLLTQLNRLLADHLDTRSFITMTYAVLDLEAGRLCYARAGHTPLLYLAADRGDGQGARLLQPGGLVLGLRIDGIDAKFEALLEEQVLPLREGDLFVLFTDGVTEAMNERADLFGEARLCRVVETHAHLAPRQLGDRILDEVAQFVGSADRHDDLTMVIVRIEG
jgi:sigma-B regulation protein RsbU (phosphoserine phosphatase)